MKKLISGILFLFGLFSVPSAFAESRCEQQFKASAEIVEVDFKDAKIAYTKALVEMGLSETSYVAKWSLTEAGRRTSQGRFPAKGEFVVTGIPARKLNTWMNQVGKDTVGLVLDDHPAANPGTAYLRVGNNFFSFFDIQNTEFVAGRPSKFSSDNLTELTLPITASEQKAILDFIKARKHKAIIATHSRGAGVKVGEPIAPSFESQKFTLAEESCAGACTSWFDLRWLEHYEAPEALKRIAQRFELKSTFVAKQMVWGHVRLPGPIGITIFGLETDPELMGSFRENNQWHSVRGIPAYGYIPDPKSGETNTIKSERLTLQDWLSDN